MSMILDKYKISQNSLLRSPEGMSNSGSDKGTEGQSKDESVKEKSKDSSDDSNTGEENDGISDLFDSEEIDENFATDSDDDDDSDNDEAATEQVAKSKALGESIRKSIDSLSIKDSDIPDDMSDKATVAKFLSEQNNKTATTVVEMIPKILKHALEIVVPNLRKEFKKDMEGNSRQTQASNSFNELGFTGSDRSLAKTFYDKALQKKMTPDKAAIATRKAMAAFGKTAKLSAKDSNSGNGVKFGKDALDDIFG